MASGVGEKKGDGVSAAFEFLAKDMVFMLVVEALNEIVDCFNWETLAVWAG